MKVSSTKANVKKGAFPEETRPMITVNYLVSGKVQGVGYRRFAQRQAEALGLGGWTRNLADGSVEVQAHGSEEQHRAFAEKLKQGPLFSVVEAVKDLKVSAQVPNGFQILEDAERPDGGFR